MARCDCWPTSEFCYCVVLEASVPSQVLWNVFCDLPNLPNINPNVTSVNVLTDGEIPTVGQKWKETRMFRDQRYVLLKTFTHVNGMSVKVSVVPLVRDDQSHTKRASQTATIEVVPSRTSPEEECKIVMTFGSVANGFIPFILMRVCSICRQRYARSYLKEEMEYYVTKAEKRYQNQLNGHPR